MREIKFRGKDECNDEWVFGVPVQDSDIKNRWYLIYVYSDGADRIIVHPETIGQYTGLKDKEGYEIYEGDIVATRHQDLAKVIWHTDFTCFCYETIDEHIKGEIQFTFSSNEIEIKGNIHENPELL